MQADNEMLAPSHQTIRGPYASSAAVSTMTDTMIVDDGMSDDSSTPDSSFDTTELMQHDVHQDEVTSQLAASGITDHKS